MGTQLYQTSNRLSAATCPVCRGFLDHMTDVTCTTTLVNSICFTHKFPSVFYRGCEPGEYNAEPACNEVDDWPAEAVAVLVGALKSPSLSHQKDPRVTCITSIKNSHHIKKGTWYYHINNSPEQDLQQLKDHRVAPPRDDQSYWKGILPTLQRPMLQQVFCPQKFQKVI